MNILSLENRPIRSLQTFLREIARANANITSVIPDGLYGNQTEQAVRDFQKEYGLPETGETDLYTWEKVIAVYEELECVRDQSRSIEMIPSCRGGCHSGESGYHIFGIQGMLIALGHRFDNIDIIEMSGNMDQATTDVIKMLQKLSLLDATGDLDISTWNAIARLYETFIVQNRQPGEPIGYPPGTRSGEDEIVYEQSDWQQPEEPPAQLDMPGRAPLPVRQCGEDMTQLEPDVMAQQPETAEHNGMQPDHIPGITGLSQAQIIENAERTLQRIADNIRRSRQNPNALRQEANGSHNPPVSENNGTQDWSALDTGKMSMQNPMRQPDYEQAADGQPGPTAQREAAEAQNVRQQSNDNMQSAAQPETMQWDAKTGCDNEQMSQDNDADDTQKDETTPRQNKGPIVWKFF